MNKNIKTYEEFKIQLDIEAETDTEVEGNFLILDDGFIDSRGVIHIKNWSSY